MCLCFCMRKAMKRIDRNSIREMFASVTFVSFQQQNKSNHSFGKRKIMIKDNQFVSH